MLSENDISIKLDYGELMKIQDINEEIQRRKGEHVNLVLTENVQNRAISPGFEDVQFIYTALPELDFYRISTNVKMFGTELSAPLIIDAMTGGYAKAKTINRDLAAVAEKAGIAFSLGSQRAMIEDPSLWDTYYVRDVAPSIPIIGNIGAVNLKSKGMIRKVEHAIKKVDANALAIHLNPLQELVQPEGDRNFEGCFSVIGETCDNLDVPVIVKEVGSGIIGEVARKLEEIGVSMVNVSGAGGTSWGRIEELRHGRNLDGLNEVGIPTVVALSDVVNSIKTPVIVSGGIRSGVDAAKGLMLGANYSAAAMPFLIAWNNGTIQTMVDKWKEEIKAVAFLVGAKNIKELRNTKPFIIGNTANFLQYFKQVNNKR